MNVWLCYFSRSGQLAHVVHSLIKASLENWTVVRLVLWPVLCPHMGGIWAGIFVRLVCNTTIIMPLLQPPTVPGTLLLNTLLPLYSLFTFTFEHINCWKLRLFMLSWEREAFSTTCYIIWMSNSNFHYYCCYFAQGTTEKESEEEREREMRVLTKPLLAWCVGHTAE